MLMKRNVLLLLNSFETGGAGAKLSNWESGTSRNFL